MMPVVNGRGHPNGHDAVKRLASKGREIGIQCIIFDRTIWSARSPNGRAYTGVHPHFDHLHIEQTRQSARTLTVARLNALLNGGVPAGIVVSPYPTVRLGASGDTVKNLQRLLNGQTSLKLKVDGKFGSQTDRAVKEFQRANGLRVDGIVGRETWTALTRPTVAPVAPKTSRRVIRHGDTGADVKALQKRLNIPDDGIFGPNTDRAAREFQRLSGLVVDGIVGPATWSALGI
jgi:peptidoglycan hydrolase-like protein with peptidoglycan-binding domain